MKAGLVNEMSCSSESSRRRACGSERFSNSTGKISASWGMAPSVFFSTTRRRAGDSSWSSRVTFGIRLTPTSRPSTCRSWVEGRGELDSGEAGAVWRGPNGNAVVLRLDQMRHRLRIACQAEADDTRLHAAFVQGLFRDASNEHRAEAGGCPRGGLARDRADGRPLRRCASRCDRAEAGTDQCIPARSARIAAGSTGRGGSHSVSRAWSACDR